MRAVILVIVMVMTLASSASAFKLGGLFGGDEKKSSAPAEGSKANDYFIEARRAYGSASYPKVIEQTTLAIKESPKFAAAYALRGKANKDMGDVDSAMKDLNHAIELDPSQGEPYFIRAQAHEINGEMKEAKKDYADACKKGYKDACK